MPTLVPRAGLCFAAASCILGVTAASFAQSPSDRRGPLPHAADHLVGRETIANTFGSSHQDAPAISMAADGTAVVAWESRRQRDGYTGIYFQRYAADGARVGDETAVDADPAAGHQHAVALTHDAAGAAWAGWVRSSDAGSALRLRRLPDGPIATLGGPDAHDLSLAARAAGGVFATWTEGDACFVQMIGSDGAPRSAAQRLPGDDRARAGQVTATADGGCAVVWSAWGDGFVPAGLRLARFDAELALAGDVTAFHGASPAGSVEASIATLADGSLLVAWMDRPADGDAYAVVATRFGADATAHGPITTVAAGGGWLSGATVVATADGYAIAFNRDSATATVEHGTGGTDVDVCIARFAADGATLGASVATFATAGRQEFPAARGARALAAGRDGLLALAWAGDAGLGDTKAAHVTWLAPTGSAAALRLIGDGAATVDGDVDLAAAGPAAAPLTATFGRTDPVGAESIVADPLEPPVFHGTLPQTRGTSWFEDGTGFTAITNTGWTPPDTVAATGPNHVAMFVNGGVGFFTKSGQRTFFASLNDFLGVPGSTFVFDPRVLFDTGSGRWICGATEHFNRTTGHFVVAVSDDDDPNGAWFKYRFDVTSIASGWFVDFPHLGVTSDAIYITSNNFGTGSGFQHHLIYILAKQPMLSGQPVTATWTRTASTSSASTGLHHDPTAGPYFARADGSGRIQLWSIRNPLTSPQLVSVNFTVAAYNQPARVTQQGTSNTLWAIDTRMSIATIRNGSLWVCHNTDSPVRTRWYEIRVGNWPASGTPTLVQQGSVAVANGHVFLPSITVDDYGNALICAAKSSSTETPSIVYYWRDRNDAAGTMRGPVTVKTSPTSYTFSQRWGDYSSVEVDPRDGATFWLAHEWCSNASTWATHVEPHRIQAPTLTTDTTSLSAATGGQVNFTLDNPAFPNRGYLLLGSISGSSPGLRLPGASYINLDLNLDDFTTNIVALVNTPTFQGFSGTLDATGQGSARLNLPPLPGLPALTMSFAYVHDISGGYDFASETVQVTIN